MAQRPIDDLLVHLYDEILQLATSRCDMAFSETPEGIPERPDQPIRLPAFQAPGHQILHRRDEVLDPLLLGGKELVGAAVAEPTAPQHTPLVGGEAAQAPAASMATLPARSAWVSVGPPLSARVVSMSTPGVIALLPEQSPLKLLPPSMMPPPEQSPPARLLATMLLVSVVVAPILAP